MQAYTDGSAKPSNPGPAGAGAVLVKDGKIVLELVHQGGWAGIGRMEVQAILMLYPYLPKDVPVTVYTDSQYVKNTLNTWLEGWIRRGWKKAGGKPPEHVDLWKQIWQYKQDYPNVRVEWIKAHAGHEFNDRADYLAKLGAERSAAAL